MRVLVAAVLITGCHEASRPPPTSQGSSQGSGSSTATPPPGRVKPPSPVETIALARDTAAVRLADGTAWTWGQSGEPARQPYPLRIPLDGAVRLSGAPMGDSFCGVLADGTARCAERTMDQTTRQWSWDESKQWGNPPATDGLTNVRAIATSYVFDCVALTDGHVSCWGEFRDTADEKDAPAHYTPVRIKGVAKAIDVGVGGLHACALLEDHHVACWGDNSDSELGIDSLDLRRRPSAAVVKGIDHVTQLSVGGSFNCALRDDGTVWCWGMGIDGQLGRGSTGGEPTPTQVPGIADVVELRAGENGACVRHKNGTVSCWGLDQTTRTIAPESAREPHTIAGITDATLLAVGDYNACVVRAAGPIVCWGDPEYGVNGDVTTWTPSEIRWK